MAGEVAQVIGALLQSLTHVVNAFAELSDLCGARWRELLERFGLCGEPSAYTLLGRDMIDATADGRGIDDLGSFRSTCSALADLGCEPSDMTDLLGLLAMMIHLGNASFDDDETGHARPTPGAGAAAVDAAGNDFDMDGDGDAE